MELDELKSAWQEMDQRVGATMAIQLDLNRELRVDRTQRSLRKFSGLPIFELITGLFSAVIAGGFLADNLGHATFLGSLAGLVIFLLGVFTVAISVWQLAMIGSIDYSAPVVEIQRTLLKITQLRIRSATWLLALLVPIWTVFPIFALQLVGKYELYKIFSPAWVAGNAVFGMVLVIAIMQIAKRGGKWFGGTSWTKLLTEESLAQAAAHLAEIERFEQDR